MKIQTQKTSVWQAMTLEVHAKVRYWEDSEINGVDVSEDGTEMPCKKGDMWSPVIDIATGKISNWEQGKSARIHFKVCDCGSYYLKDEKGMVRLDLENVYVPDCLAIDDNGYGDYIIMTIDETGQIANWNPDFSDWRRCYS